MSTSLSQTLATSVATENRMTATQIAQELLDRVRDCPFSSLPTAGPQYPVPVYSDDGITVGPSPPPFAQYPLLMDVTSGNYGLVSRGAGPTGSPFKVRTATPHLSPATFAQGAPPQLPVLVTINITWTEGTAKRSLALQLHHLSVGNAQLHEKSFHCFERVSPARAESGSECSFQL